MGWPRKRNLIYWAIVYGTVAAALTAVHAWKVDVPRIEEQKRWHADVLAGRAPRPYNARVLQPLVVEAACDAVPARLRDDVFTFSYSGIRFVSILATLVAFELFLLAFVALDPARLVVLFLSGIFALGYHGYHYQPSSVLDLALFTVALLAIVRGRDPLLVPLMVVATLNRNTSIFILATYVLWHGPALAGGIRGARREWAVSLGMAAAWGLTTLGIERLFPGSGWVGSPGGFIVYNLSQWRVWLLSGVVALPLVTGLIYGWRRAPSALRRIAFVAVPYVGLHFAMAKCEEVRYWLNLVVLLGPFLGLAYETLTARSGEP